MLMSCALESSGTVWCPSWVPDAPYRPWVQALRSYFHHAGAVVGRGAGGPAATDPQRKPCVIYNCVMQALWLGVEPADLLLYVFLPPILLDSAARIDFFVFKKARPALNSGLGRACTNVLENVLIAICMHACERAGFLNAMTFTT